MKRILFKSTICLEMRGKNQFFTDYINFIKIDFFNQGILNGEQEKKIHEIKKITRTCFFVKIRLESRNKVTTFAALKNGKLINLYANYCTISTKRKSHTHQEE